MFLDSEEPGYTYYNLRGCDGRNDLIDEKVANRGVCRSKCDDNYQCISFEWWGDSNPPNYLCHGSSSCTYEISEETGGSGDHADLYVKGK